MNKHRKAESRRVKACVRMRRAAGFDTSYKKARRIIRKHDRAMRDLPKKFTRGCVRGVKRVNRSMAEAVAEFAKLASSFSSYRAGDRRDGVLRRHPSAVA